MSYAGIVKKGDRFRCNSGSIYEVDFINVLDTQYPYVMSVVEFGEGVLSELRQKWEHSISRTRGETLGEYIAMKRFVGMKVERMWFARADVEFVGRAREERTDG